MKDYNKDEEESFLKYDDANDLYRWAMFKKLPVRSFMWVKNVSKLDEDFIKNYDDDGDIGYFLK